VSCCFYTHLNKEPSVRNQDPSVRIMVNYSQGKIYKLYSLKSEQVYVGSTCRTLAKRLDSHLSAWKRFKAGDSMYATTSFQILELGDYKMEVLELCQCESRDELHACEGKWIRRLNCVNKNIAGRDKKQYDIDNRVAIRAQRKRYRAANKDAISVRMKQYESDNRVAIRVQKKQYGAANKDAIRLRNNQYWAANKDAINAKRRAYSAKKKKEAASPKASTL
jgi:hypothetical protein